MRNADRSILLSQLIDKFLCTIENPHTRRSYRNDLQILLSHLESHSADPLVDAWTSDVTAALFTLNRDDWSAATSERRLASFSTFAGWINMTLGVSINPLSTVTLESMEEASLEVLTPRDIAAIRRYAAKSAYLGMHLQEPEWEFKALRAWLSFELMLGAGLRVEDLSLITISQVPPLMDVLREVRSPGYKLVDIPVIEDVRTHLNEYLSARRERLAESSEYRRIPISLQESVPLMISLFGADHRNSSSFGMGRKTIWRAINELGRGGGVRHLNPRLLRNTFTVTLFRSSLPRATISRLLRVTSSRISQMQKKCVG